MLLKKSLLRNPPVHVHCGRSADAQSRGRLQFPPTETPERPSFKCQEGLGSQCLRSFLTKDRVVMVPASPLTPGEV